MILASADSADICASANPRAAAEYGVAKVRDKQSASLPLHLRRLHHGYLSRLKGMVKDRCHTDHVNDQPDQDGVSLTEPVLVLNWRHCLPGRPYAADMPGLLDRPGDSLDVLTVSI